MKIAFTGELSVRVIEGEYAVGRLSESDKAFLVWGRGKTRAEAIKSADDNLDKDDPIEVIMSYIR